MDAAIRWCADHGIRVVNLSWDGADSPVLNLAAKYLRDTIDGVVVMAGVNGSGFLNYTNQPYIVAVSMTDSSDQLRSHYGNHIDFAAPGYNVYSTTVYGYATGQGTSFAAPLVSGILATLFSIHPSLTAEQALSVLKATAVDLGTPGWDQQFGWGRVDFYQAAWLAAALTPNPPTLKMQGVEPAQSNLFVSTEYHPGLGYSLQRSPTLNPADWSAVAAEPQTNGTTIGFAVELESGASFYKIAGEPNL
jgi:subtilisin family serine protease